MDSDQLSLVSDAARLLGRSAETIRYYSNVGKLPAVRTVGGTRLFRESDVRKLAVELAKAQEQPAR